MKSNLYYTTEIYDSSSSYNSKIFLAGPCYRDRNTEWRKEFIQLINEYSFTSPLDIFIPEFRNYPLQYEPDFDEIFDWENEFLNYADLIVFWIPRSKEMPGLTTNVEFGRFVGCSNVVYGRPDNAESIRYLDKLYKFENPGNNKICNSIIDLVSETVSRLK